MSSVVHAFVSFATTELMPPHMPLSEEIGTLTDLRTGKSAMRQPRR